MWAEFNPGKHLSEPGTACLMVEEGETLRQRKAEGGRVTMEEIDGIEGPSVAIVICMRRRNHTHFSYDNNSSEQ